MTQKPLRNWKAERRLGMEKSLMTKEDAYHKGFVDGLSCFAHWKNGKELVGTRKTLLKEVVYVARTQWSYDSRFVKKGA